LNPVLIAGPGHETLASATAAWLAVALADAVVRRHPDGEVGVEIRESIRGRDVYVIQPTGPPVDEALVELLLIGDACRRAGAGRIAAVVPYFGYARSDRRASGREAVGARLVADLIQTAGFARVVAVDLHAPAIEGFFTIPVEHLSAVPVLAEWARSSLDPDATTLVAPDLGAVKLAGAFARLLELPVAMVQKRRTSDAEVSALGVSGELHGRRVAIVDDMISTGATIEAAVRAAIGAGARSDGVTVIATHGLFAGPALPRLRSLPISRIVTTDSVPVSDLPGLTHDVVSLAPLLGEAIRRIAREESLTGLAWRM
jgi:ribose-phosphate pyrophosphokinase